MRHIFPFLLLLLSLYINSCANQGTPTGGPKDTIPPTLLETMPKPQSTNYKGQVFNFVFDEKIDASKLKRELLITPLTDIKYDIKVRKNILTLTFEESFEKNTTYTLNFGEGVVDITEKNAVQNFSLAFSTGPIIDSIYINGKIKDLYTDQVQKECVVALFQITDSLDFFKDKPRYFAKTNKSGLYQINNIKTGHYKLVVYKDDNKNLLLNPDSEAHGFLADSINLTTSKDSIQIPIQLIDASAFKFVRAKTKGHYYEAQYNKGIVKYTIEKRNKSNLLTIPSYNRVNNVIRFYYNKNYKYDKDSIALIISATDSMQNKTIDTVQVKFSTSKRKKQKFQYSTTPKNKSNIDQIIDHQINFNKPIATFYSDSIQFRYDTLYTQSIVDSTITWNNTKTVLNFSTSLDQKLLKSRVDTLLKTLSDTTITDSLLISQRAYYKKIATNVVNFKIPKGTFISIEQDTAKETKHYYVFKSQDNSGSVSGKVVTERKSYTLQLVDKNFNIIESLENVSDFIFPFVKPGDYSFRILIDDNQDGEWSYGNILNDNMPEPIYFYPESFTIRANWELDNIIINME